MRLTARRAEPSWLQPGTVLDGHEILGQTDGRAGPELRYEARSPDGTPTTVTIGRRMFSDRRDRSRFRRLAGARMALDHPAAIRVRGVTEYAHHPVLVADQYPKDTLADVLARAAALPPERVVTLLAPVADALDRAHAAGLAHRTLSAHSLLLAGPDQLMLDTFGLLSSEHVDDWSVLGSRDVRYISPEQLRGLPAGPAGNVYSLTALAVHALTGEPPFTGDQPTVMYAHLVNPPPSVSGRRSELGRRLDAAVSAGLAKEPAARPRSATELVRMLADALGERPRTGSLRAEVLPRLPTEEEQPAAGARPRGRRGAAILAATLVATAAAAGAVAAIAVAPFGGEDSAPAAQTPVSDTWKQMASTRGELRDRLAAADTPKAQAEAATALGDLYGNAARTGRPRALAAAAREASAAYERLASAAGLNDDAGYLDAARAVEGAEGRLSLAASRH